MNIINVVRKRETQMSGVSRRAFVVFGETFQDEKANT